MADNIPTKKGSNKINPKDLAKVVDLKKSSTSVAKQPTLSENKNIEPNLKQKVIQYGQDWNDDDKYYGFEYKGNKPPSDSQIFNFANKIINSTANFSGAGLESKNKVSIAQKMLSDLDKKLTKRYNEDTFSKDEKTKKIKQFFNNK